MPPIKNSQQNKNDNKPDVERPEIDDPSEEREREHRHETLNNADHREKGSPDGTFQSVLQSVRKKSVRIT